MKYLLLIFTAFALLFMSACEKEEEFPDHEAHIRFVNHTNMVFDSVVNKYNCIDDFRHYHQEFVDLHPGDTSEYQSDINIEGFLTVRANTPDTTYLCYWSYPKKTTDPIDPEYACFFETGYYTFSLYNTDSQSNTLYAGLISYEQ
ncbi:MAG: hypothetical protein R6V32_09610 [Bacteroidales bacterium]